MLHLLILVVGSRAAASGIRASITTWRGTDDG